MSVKKRILERTIFLLVMFLTFYTLFSGKNLGEIANAVSKMSVGYLVPAAALANLFVCAEGYMIWYLLQAMKANRRKEGSSLIRCIRYSFIGFFYSGITPSATGGTACAALLYEQRREQRIGQYGCAYDSCCCL